MGSLPLGSPVDPDVLEMLASLQEPGEPDILIELLTLFLRDTPERLRDLTSPAVTAVEAGRVAHAVKGSAANLGATQLQTLAHDLEAACRGAISDSDVRAHVTGIVTEYARVERHLQELIATRERK